MADFNHAVHHSSQQAELMARAIKHAIINREVSHLTFADEVQVAPQPEHTAAKTPAGRVTPIAISPPREMLDRALHHLQKAKVGL
ncbi:MAG: hypothetical protein AAF998_26660 [Bacteroidota bacterium]